MPLNGLHRKHVFLRYIFSKRAHSKAASSNPSDYCLHLVKNNDHENFLCTLLLPRQTRSAAIAIRAFNVEISKAAVASKDEKIAAMRLQFWHETIGRIYQGNPPNQPVALELAKVISKHDLKKRYFTRLIKAREDQLGQTVFQSLEKMEAYSEETVSPIIYLTLEAAGVKDIHADHAASHVGKGQGLTILLRIVGSGGGTWGLPQDLLKAAGLGPNMVAQNSTLTKDIVFKIASRAKAHIDKARSCKHQLPRATSIHFLPAVSADHYLTRLRDADFDIFEPLLKERDARLGLALFWAKLTNRY